MKNNTRKTACFAIGMLTAFALWTTAVQWVDVRAVGPEGSTVGFAAMNQYVHSLTGVHLSLYILTDWLSLIPLGVVAGFGIFGLVQWIKRRHLLKVDYSILVLGGFYIVTMTVYVLFEYLTVNYRPILIDGVLEVSYPSSTTVLVLCVMTTAILQLRERIQNRTVKQWVISAIAVYTVLMVAGRLVSGVHWFSDIIGGVLLSAGLVLMYETICRLKLSK